MSRVLTPIVFVALALWYGSTHEKSPTAEPAESSCKSDWRKCADNSDMANNYSGWNAARYACMRATDEQVRYGTPEWPFYPFGTFQGGTDYKTSGTGLLTEPNAKVSNGFGAMVHARVECNYNLETNKVFNIFIDPA